jgi:hypothetical protein
MPRDKDAGKPLPKQRCTLLYVTESYMDENDGRGVLSGGWDGEEPECGCDGHGDVF